MAKLCAEEQPRNVNQSGNAPAPTQHGATGHGPEGPSNVEASAPSQHGAAAVVGVWWERESRARLNTAQRVIGSRCATFGRPKVIDTCPHQLEARRAHVHIKHCCRCFDHAPGRSLPVPPSDRVIGCWEHVLHTRRTSSGRETGIYIFCNDGLGVPTECLALSRDCLDLGWSLVLLVP